MKENINNGDTTVDGSSTKSTGLDKTYHTKGSDTSYDNISPFQNITTDYINDTMVDTIYCLRDTIFLTYCGTAAVERKRSERKGYILLPEYFVLSFMFRTMYL